MWARWTIGSFVVAAAIKWLPGDGGHLPAGPQDVESENLLVFPDRRQAIMQTPQGEIHIVVTPQAAFMHAPAMNATRDLPSSMRDDELQEIKRDELYVAQHANDPKFMFNAAGTEKINGVDTSVLHINADGAGATWWVDPARVKALEAGSK